MFLEGITEQRASAPWSLVRLLICSLYHFYIMIFSISSSHQISSYFILFIYLFTCSYFVYSNIITAAKLLRFRGKYSSTYKPLWAVTVFADDDFDMTNPLFWNASGIENDIRSPYLSSRYFLFLLILIKKKKKNKRQKQIELLLPFSPSFIF